MKNNTALRLLLWAFFVIVFNVIFFLFVDNADRTATIWINYAFIHFAVLFVLLIPKLSLQGKYHGDYIRPLLAVAVIYFLLTLVTGCVMIFGVVGVETKIACLVQVLLLFVAVAFVLFTMMANNHTHQQAEQHQTDLQYVRRSSSAVQTMIDRYGDQRLGELFDLLRTSPVRSSADAAPIEQCVIELLGQLEQAYSTADARRQESLIDDLKLQANKRNRML